MSWSSPPSLSWLGGRVVVVGGGGGGGGGGGFVLSSGLLAYLQWAFLWRFTSQTCGVSKLSCVKYRTQREGASRASLLGDSVFPWDEDRGA